MERNPAFEAALHGKTILVKMADGKLYVGRCSRFVERDLILVHADLHEETEGSPPRDEYLKKISKMGHWPRIEKIFLPCDEIDSVERIKERTGFQAL